MPDDRLDTKIQALMVELVDSTPPPPTWESIQAHLADRALRTGAAPGATTVATAADPGEITDLPDYARHEERRRPRWRPLAAGTGAVGVLVGGAFAYASLVGSDGAANPEAAVEQFVESITAEDAIGAFESLPPSERSLLTDAATDLAGESERLGLTDGLALGDVEGFDFELEGLTLEPETLGEGVVAVHIDGTLTSGATGEELPLGNYVLDLIEGDGGGLRDFEGEVIDLGRIFAEEDVFLVAVEEGGGWHTSVWYTLAEYIRRADDQPLPSFGRGTVAPRGADSPEQAVRSLIDAVQARDLAGALALAAPGESRVLYDYVPLWLDDAAGSPPYDRSATIHRLDLAVSGDGDTRVVEVQGYDYSATDEFGTWRSSYADGCFTWFSQASPIGGAEPEEDTTCRAEALEEGVLAAEWDMGIGAQYVVVQDGGRWYISPVRSVTASLLAAGRAIPDAATAAEVLERNGVWPFYMRVWNLYGSFYGYGQGPLLGVGSSSSECSAGIDADGNLTGEECTAGASSFDEMGIPLDENGEPIDVPATVTTVMDSVPPTTGDPARPGG